MKKTKVWLFVALALCFVGMVGAAFVQSSGGNVEVKDLRWETPSGHMMSALLFVPDGVSEENPAPGIVTSHGWFNNREMQDLNFVELSRRGYVVMSIDMYGHGNSDAVKPEEWPNRGTGMYDAVELTADLPYVDTSKIGVTGHSFGARAADWSVDADNEKDNPLISSVLLIGNDATYMNPDTGEYINKYGNRDVGIVAAKYDEFFFRTPKADGTFTKPKEYISTDNAQSFLHFGASPEDFSDTRSSYELYTENVDGEEATRVIYNPGQTHPWNHFSQHVVEQTLEFFDATLGSPESIAPTNQIWPFKVLFNFLGLIGFGMFLVSFTKVLIQTKPFAVLRAKEAPAAAVLSSGKQKAWFWGGLVVSAIFSGFSYLWLFGFGMTQRPDFFPQGYTFYIGIWAAVNGIFAIVLMVVLRKLTPKENRPSLESLGVKLSFKALMKTIVLSLTVCASAYALVFLSDYLFKTDFRLWVLGVKAFTPDKLIIALKYLPFFLLFFVANSVAINSFNYVRNGKSEWMNTALVALFNGLGVMVVFALQYVTFFATGEVFFKDVSPIAGIWLTSIIFILPIGAIISRKIFKATLNPYLGGIIFAIIVTLISVTNTLTQL